MCEGYNERKDREWKDRQVELYLQRFMAVSVYNVGASLSKEVKGIKEKDLMHLPLFDDREAKDVDFDEDRIAETIKKDKRPIPDGFNDRTDTSET